jgi:hypothetical protein
VQTVTQLSTQAATQLIDIQDISALPVTITSNNGVSLATNGLAGLLVNSINFQSTGDLIVQGSVLPGNVGVAANVALVAGQSMTLNGNVGVNPAGSITTIIVGNNNLGTGNLFQGKGVAIIGDTVNLNSTFAINGDLGTAATPINTQAVTSVVINETGDGYVANNSLANPNLALVVTASRSINFTNTGTVAGGPVLTLGGTVANPGNVLANSNGGGAIVISNNGLINVGLVGNKTAITGNSVDIFNTGTNAAGIDVLDTTNVTANIGSIIMTAGTTAGGGLTIGTAGGAGVTMNATAGNITLGCAEGDKTGTVAIGDNINLATNASAGGQGSISISSPTTMTISGGGKAGLTMTTNNGGNIALTAGGNLTTSPAGLITAKATNGNISLASTGGNISVDQVALTTQVSKVSNLGGSINISAFGTVDIADQTAGDNLAMTTAGTNSGLSVTGSSITMGNATAKNETITVTGGNVAMNATATGATATGITLGNLGDAFTITTKNNASNQGNIALTSAENITLGSAINFNTASAFTDTTAGNITLVAAASTTGNSINVEGGTLKTNSNGLGSGSITLDGSTATGESVTIGSVNAATINASGVTGSVSVLSNNNLTVADKTNITAGQSLSLVAGDGTAGSALVIGALAGAGGALLANDGNILLQTDASSTTPTTGTITIGTLYSVTANAPAVPLGNVTIAVDAASGATGAFPATANYTVTVGAGGGSITATGGAVPLFNAPNPGTTFKANFANLTIFNNGSTGAGAITFDGKNAIQADPPAPAASAAISSVTVPTLLPTETGAVSLQAARTPDSSAIQANLAGFTTGESTTQPATTGTNAVGFQTAALPVNTLGTVAPAAYSGALSGSLFSSLSSINSMGLQTYGQIYEASGPGQEASRKVPATAWEAARHLLPPMPPDCCRAASPPECVAIKRPAPVRWQSKSCLGAPCCLLPIMPPKSIPHTVPCGWRVTRLPWLSQPSADCRCMTSMTCTAIR